MLKYLSVVKIALLNSFAYKNKLFFYALTGIVQFIVCFFLWRSIFSNIVYYKGFTLEDIITYFILSFIIQSILPKWIAMEIGWAVKRGEISTNLLRPISLETYFLLYSLGDVIFTFIFMGTPIILVGLFSKNVLPCSNVFLFIISLINSYIINFYMFYIIGLLSFWFINIWGIFITFDFITLFFAGTYIPIKFMPNKMQFIINLLPFRYTVGFPISVWLGNTIDIISFIIQLVWLIVLLYISKFLYKKAIVKLEVLGG